MIIEVVGKEIEKIKGDFESYLNGLNMVGEISYSQYSELYDEGTKQIQRAYELGKSELEKENVELERKLEQTEKDLADYQFNYPTIKELQKEIAELKKTYRKQRNKRIDELQKENAELKKKNLDTQDAVTMQMYTNKANKEIADKQLTKAKELLKRCYDNYIYLQPLRGDIEQFLKEEE